MLKELKFVQGAVAKKDLVAAMTHFAIADGFVRAYNGVLALCSPIPLDIACKPKAGPMVQAIGHCTETATLSLTPAGKLKIQSGKFKALIECIDEVTPHVDPEGEEISFDGESLLAGLKVISPFIGNDASRAWSNGVLLKGQSLFATNNVTLIEYWLGSNFPIIANIPAIAIKELIRINQAPTHGQVTQNSITFHYDDGRWIRSQLFTTEWPDLERVLSKECDPVAIDDLIFEGLETIKNFADKNGRVYLKPGKLQTHETEDEAGAVFEVPSLDAEGIYRIEMLNLLRGVAQKADLSLYPGPCVFYGDRIRGAIIGMKM